MTGRPARPAGRRHPGHPGGHQRVRRPGHRADRGRHHRGGAADRVGQRQDLPGSAADGAERELRPRHHHRVRHHAGVQRDVGRVQRADGERPDLRHRRADRVPDSEHGQPGAVPRPPAGHRVRLQRRAGRGAGDRAGHPGHARGWWTPWTASNCPGGCPAGRPAARTTTSCSWRASWRPPAASGGSGTATSTCRPTRTTRRPPPTRAGRTAVPRPVVPRRRRPPWPRWPRRPAAW